MGSTESSQLEEPGGSSMCEDAEGADTHDAALASWLEMWQEASGGEQSSSRTVVHRPKKKVVAVPDDGDMAQWLAKWSDLVLEPPEESRTVSDTLNPYAIVITRTGEEPPSEVLEDADSASQRDLGLSQALHCLEAAQVATEAADWSSVSESLQQLLCLLQSEGEKTQEWKGRMDGYVEQELLAGSMTQLLLRTLRTATARQQEVDVGEFEDNGVNQAIIDSACSVLALLGDIRHA